MKKIYFAGKFNKIKKPEISLEKSLRGDFRSQLLGDSKLLTHFQNNLVVNNKFQYIGPFYCEQASNGDFTSTDCNEVQNAEYNKNGWNKELNLISWNEREPVYDIRTWSPDHEKMGKGITISIEEAKALRDMLNTLKLD